MKLVEELSERVKKANSNMDVDLNEPDFSVVCHLSNSCLAVGLPISRHPLSTRPYLRHVGLRATICSAMLQIADVANIQTTFIIDPFCGQSTISAEFMNTFPKPFWIGSDSSIDQLNRSCDNLEKFSAFHDLIQANLCETSMFPYRSRIAELIISDLPFGKNHSIKYFSSGKDHHSKLAVFYTNVLKEFERILVKTGTVVLLVNSNELNIFKQCFGKLKELKIVSINLVSLGETGAAIVKLTNF